MLRKVCVKAGLFNSTRQIIPMDLVSVDSQAVVKGKGMILY